MSDGTIDTGRKVLCGLIHDIWQNIFYLARKKTHIAQKRIIDFLTLSEVSVIETCLNPQNNQEMLVSISILHINKKGYCILFSPGNRYPHFCLLF